MSSFIFESIVQFCVQARFVFDHLENEREREERIKQITTREMICL